MNNKHNKTLEQMLISDGKKFNHQPSKQVLSDVIDSINTTEFNNIQDRKVESIREKWSSYSDTFKRLYESLYKGQRTKVQVLMPMGLALLCVILVNNNVTENTVHTPLENTLTKTQSTDQSVNQKSNEKTTKNEINYIRKSLQLSDISTNNISFLSSKMENKITMNLKQERKAIIEDYQTFKALLVL